MSEEQEDPNLNIWGAKNPLTWVTDEQLNRDLDIEKAQGLTTNNILTVVGVSIAIWVIIVILLLVSAKRSGDPTKPSLEDMVILAVSIAVIALLYSLSWNSTKIINEEQDNKIAAMATVIRRWLSDETVEHDNELSEKREAEIRRLVRERRAGTNTGYCENNTNPCFNGGTCVNGSTDDTFTCENCNFGWVGNTCNESDVFTIDERCQVNGENQANVEYCGEELDVCSSNCPNLELLWCESTGVEYETPQEWVTNCPEHEGHPEYCTEADADYNSDECRNWRAHCDTEDETVCKEHSQCTFEDDKCSF